MKTSKLHFAWFATIASIVFMVSMSSCSVKAKFLTSKVVPAAQGIVQIKSDNNKNYAIKIEISNLSPSTRLTPPSNAYVVWLIDSENNTKNLGQLNSSDNFMAKNLNAEFETVSSTKPTKIVITAENDASVQKPSLSEVILTTDFIKVKK